MAEEKSNTFEVAYEQAFTLACEELLKKDIPLCCTYAGAQVIDRQENTFSIEITFLNKTIHITIPQFVFTANGSDDVHIWEKIVILHYLANSDGTDLAGSMINYKQVKDGSLYFPTFDKRSIKPLVAVFGEAPHMLVKASASLGAEEIDYGDVGIKIMAFPMVPLFFVIWKGDEEFPAEGGIMFDASIEKRLSAEDIAVLCQQIVFRIIKIKKQIESLA